MKNRSQWQGARRQSGLYSESSRALRSAHSSPSKSIDSHRLQTQARDRNRRWLHWEQRTQLSRCIRDTAPVVSRRVRTRSARQVLRQAHGVRRSADAAGAPPPRIDCFNEPPNVSVQDMLQERGDPMSFHRCRDLASVCWTVTARHGKALLSEVDVCLRGEGPEMRALTWRFVR